MANFTNSSYFEVHDDYYTPRSAWGKITNSIPKDKIIWEACMLNAPKSSSMQYLEDLGTKKVVGDTSMDILKDQPEEWDLIITNIPFDYQIKLPILRKLVEFDKPFIIIMNSLNTFSKYFHEIFKDHFEDLQIITPSSKINFDKLLDTGELKPTKRCSFYCVYVCYKLKLPADQLWVK